MSQTKGSSRQWRLYLSASIANAALNRKLSDFLPRNRFELILPQEFTPVGIDHPLFPRAIYERCIEEIDRSDAGILLLDAFGVDCASEAGWFAARGKPLIGIAIANCRWLRHWMVKGNMTAVVCMDKVLFETVNSDPILKHIPVLECGRWEELADTLSFLLADKHIRHMQAAK